MNFRIPKQDVGFLDQLSDWKGCRMKRPWPDVRYYPGMCLDGLRKNTKILSHDSRSPGQYLDSGRGNRHVNHSAASSIICPWRWRQISSSKRWKCIPYWHGCSLGKKSVGLGRFTMNGNTHDTWCCNPSPILISWSNANFMARSVGIFMFSARCVTSWGQPLWQVSRVGNLWYEYRSCQVYLTVVILWKSKVSIFYVSSDETQQSLCPCYFIRTVFEPQWPASVQPGKLSQYFNIPALCTEFFGFTNNLSGLFTMWHTLAHRHTHK